MCTLCDAEGLDVCERCGQGSGECLCQDCPECYGEYGPADMDGDSGLCLDCHAACHGECGECGEECHRDDLNGRGLCEACEAERVEAMADAVRDVLDDPSKVEAIHSALRAAGLL